MTTPISCLMKMPAIQKKNKKEWKNKPSLTPTKEDIEKEEELCCQLKHHQHNQIFLFKNQTLSSLILA